MDDRVRRRPHAGGSALANLAQRERRAASSFRRYSSWRMLDSHVTRPPTPTRPSHSLDDRGGLTAVCPGQLRCPASAEPTSSGCEYECRSSQVNLTAARASHTAVTTSPPAAGQPPRRPRDRVVHLCDRCKSGDIASRRMTGRIEAKPWRPKGDRRGEGFLRSGASATGSARRTKRWV
jgi:hypothetical protein